MVASGREPRQPAQAPQQPQGAGRERAAWASFGGGLRCWMGTALAPRGWLIASWVVLSLLCTARYAVEPPAAVPARLLGPQSLASVPTVAGTVSPVMRAVGRALDNEISFCLRA